VILVYLEFGIFILYLNNKMNLLINCLIQFKFIWSILFSVRDE